MSDRNRNGDHDPYPRGDDPLDDIGMEEFRLQEPSQWEETEYQPQGPESLKTCPSCYSRQSQANRHCQECGARLDQHKIAVGPVPIRSVTAGSRAVRVIITGLAFVLIFALIIQALRSDDEPETVAAENQTTEVTEVTEATVSLGPLEEVTPISISCSSEYNANLGCENLIDGEETYWNDESRRGEDARITATFVNPVALEQVQIINITNLEKFRRNYRVRGVEIYADDFPGVPFVDQIPDANDRPHGIPTTTNHTTILEIRVTSTWASESLGGERAFDELAIQEIKFWGRIQDSAGG